MSFSIFLAISCGVCLRVGCFLSKRCPVAGNRRRVSELSGANLETVDCNTNILDNTHQNSATDIQHRKRQSWASRRSMFRRTIRPFEIDNHRLDTKAFGNSLHYKCLHLRSFHLYCDTEKLEFFKFKNSQQN